MGAFKYEKRYRELHQEHPKWFSGALKPVSVQNITDLVRDTGAKTLLDYGSGKGYQYLATRVHEAWGGILPVCYDVGVIQLKNKPTGRFDGAICTDVMEHIAHDNVEEVLADVCQYATKFAYFAICCRPARKSFNDGVNVHLTVRTPRWWNDVLKKYNRKNFIIRADYEVNDDPTCYDDE